MLSSYLLLSAASVLVHVAAQSRVEDIDIPQQCRSTCQPLLDQSRNCDDQYSQDDNNDGLDQGYVNCICSAQNAANYIPQCNSCIQQDPNYLNSDNNNAFNNNGYNEVQQWMQTCNFQNGGINGGNIYPTPTYNGYGNGGDGYGLVYITTYDQYGNPQVVQTPVPTGVNGAGGYYPGDSGYVTSYDQYGNPQVIQTQGGDGSYYPGNVIGGNYGNPVSVRYTTTTETDQYGNRQTFVTPVSTAYASLTTSWSTTRTTDAFGHETTYRVPYVSFTGGAAQAVATAQAVMGAGAGLLMAALAL